MDVAETRLHNLVNLQGGLSRRELCDRIGIDYVTVGFWFMDKSKDGHRNISSASARKIEAAFGKPHGWLDQFHDDAYKAELDEEKYILISRLEATAGLGSGRHNDHVEISGSHAYRRDWILKMGWRSEALVVIDAEGPSMAPAVNDGDIVLVNMDEVTIKSGEVYAIEDPHQGTRIKRLFRTSDGRVRLSSDNPDKRLHPDDFFTPETGARVIGRVVHRSGSV